MVEYRLPSLSPPPTPPLKQRLRNAKAGNGRPNKNLPGAFPASPPKLTALLNPSKKRLAESNLVPGPGKGFRPSKRARITLDEGPSSPWREDRQREWFVNVRDRNNNLVRAVAKELAEKPGEVDWEAIYSMYRKLQNQYLVRLLDFTTLGDKTGAERGPTHWEAWEYCDGKPNTIGRILAQTPAGVEEPFVWHVLTSLLRAVLWLHEGRTEVDPWAMEEPNWTPIVHNNINPDTIFLTAPREGQVYGQVKLGNFTRCRLLHERNSLERRQNINLFKAPEGQGQEDFEAPELSWYISRDPEVLNLSPRSMLRFLDQRGLEDEASEPFGGRSDLWSIGAVVVALMGGAYVPESREEVYEPYSKARGFAMRSLELAREGKDRWQAHMFPQSYSLSLRVCLEKLLIFDPAKRFSISEALHFVSTKWDRWRKLDAGCKPWQKPGAKKGPGLKGILKKVAPALPKAMPFLGDDEEDLYTSGAQPLPTVPQTTTDRPGFKTWRQRNEDNEATQNHLGSRGYFKPGTSTTRPTIGYGSLAWAQARRREREAAEAARAALRPAAPSRPKPARAAPRGPAASPPTMPRRGPGQVRVSRSSGLSVSDPLRYRPKLHASVNTDRREEFFGGGGDTADAGGEVTQNDTSNTDNDAALAAALQEEEYAEPVPRRRGRRRATAQNRPTLDTIAEETEIDEIDEYDDPVGQDLAADEGRIDYRSGDFDDDFVTDADQGDGGEEYEMSGALQ
ncbi:uncharacterized protein MYCFIDRAFT_193051 [Pseudocercospora fijiensis CIRAD86]|uniref:non-specific serine/threonine protein kinase n=1 Tax=Pseudocercospora fijiensis (strain CIRAD86) TaxID=383855 RepID=N1Q862_PSEFD|nr:uncharacterized protein MYCFIDRAFT_193051 [Pseudocercospora fijiensis CIRAD86]EME89035.1 hypothetical protein MYCFIDRAFT_193051 [Pseudocercospora fijiensis CIRAD86]